MVEDLFEGTRIDDHRSLLVSRFDGKSYIDAAEAGQFPSGGDYYVYERDDRLACDPYVIANVATLDAARRLIECFRAAARPSRAPLVMPTPANDADSELMTG